MGKSRVRKRREYRWRSASYVKQLEEKAKFAEDLLHKMDKREQRLRQVIKEQREALIRAQMLLTNAREPNGDLPPGTYLLCFYDSFNWLGQAARLALAPEVWNPMEVK